MLQHADLPNDKLRLKWEGSKRSFVSPHPMKPVKAQKVPPKWPHNLVIDGVHAQFWCEVRAHRTEAVYVDGNRKLHQVSPFQIERGIHKAADYDGQQLELTAA